MVMVMVFEFAMVGLLGKAQSLRGDLSFPPVTCGVLTHNLGGDWFNMALCLWPVQDGLLIIGDN
jgi:hypothetical protein